MLHVNWKIYPWQIYVNDVIILILNDKNYEKDTINKSKTLKESKSFGERLVGK